MSCGCLSGSCSDNPFSQLALPRTYSPGARTHTHTHAAYNNSEKKRGYDATDVALVSSPPPQLNHPQSSCKAGLAPAHAPAGNTAAHPLPPTPPPPTLPPTLLLCLHPGNDCRSGITVISCLEPQSSESSVMSMRACVRVCVLEVPVGCL